MKLPVAIMLLEEGISESITYNCNGKYTFPSGRKRIEILENGDIDTIFLDTKKCHANHGENIDLKEAISESCNVYFYQSVDREYKNIYKNKWYPWMEKFGFTDIANIDLLYEKKGNIQNSPNKTKMINLVIGQEMLVTPLQVMQMINVIANEGVMTKLHFNKNSDISPLIETTKMGNKLIFTSLTLGSSASSGKSDLALSTCSLVSKSA